MADGKTAKLALKYGPEVFNYFSSKNALKELSEAADAEQFAGERREITPAEQSQINRANFAVGRDQQLGLDAAQQFILNQSSKTKGGIRNLSQILSGGARAQAELQRSLDAERSKRLATAAGLERSQFDSDREFEVAKTLWERNKNRRLLGLEMERRGLQQDGASSLFDLGGDALNLFLNRNKSEEEEEEEEVNRNKSAEEVGANIGTTKEDILRSSLDIQDIEMEEEPEEEGGDGTSAETKVNPMRIQDVLGSDFFAEDGGLRRSFKQGGAFVTPGNYDHDGVDILMTDRSNGDVVGTVEGAEVIIPSDDMDEMKNLAKKSPKSALSKYIMQLLSKYNKEIKK